MVKLPGVSGKMGELHYWENMELFPQGIRRCFWISSVPEGEIRGNHAHWKESQLLVAVEGSVEVTIADSHGEDYLFTLNSPEMGLLIPPLHWVEVKFSPKTILLGLSDRDFSEDDYIRDKDYFGSLHKRN